MYRLLHGPFTILVLIIIFSLWRPQVQGFMADVIRAIYDYQDLEKCHPRSILILTLRIVSLGQPCVQRSLAGSTLIEWRYPTITPARVLVSPWITVCS